MPIAIKSPAREAQSNLPRLTYRAVAKGKVQICQVLKHGCRIDRDLRLEPAVKDGSHGEGQEADCSTKPTNTRNRPHDPHVDQPSEMRARYHALSVWMTPMVVVTVELPPMIPP